jgi:DNA repair exonuclease SbcCD ATPase subunit
MNVLDKIYQRELVKSYLKSRFLDDHFEEISKLDKIVQDRLISDNELTPFKKWKIKRIEFSNFLSFGENQVLDLEKYYGITSIESNPPNFGGKTAVSTDLMLFLFFNETSKTTKAEDIFNLYTDKDKVRVKGEITIDGNDYIIERTITRRRSKGTDWSYKTDLEFYQKFENGDLHNLTGEQRKETEQFIKSSIGTKDDFLMTILTTSGNLEDLIEAKPTARGAVLSRFMGLDFLKRKEEAGKEIYSTFAKSMISNVYNSDQLNREIVDFENKIEEAKKDNARIKENIALLDERIRKGKEYRDSLYAKKHSDIDREISQLNPESVKGEINAFKFKIEGVVRQIAELKLVEPTEFFDEERYDKIKEEYNNIYKESIVLEQKIKSIEELKNSVNGGIKCDHCGIELHMASITQSKISQLETLKSEYSDKKALLVELKNDENRFITIKKEFDEYEKNKLVKDKYELTIDSYNDKIKILQTNLDKYYLLQDKISENEKTEDMIIKSGLKISELEAEKNIFQRQISSNDFIIESNTDKIEQNHERIEKIEQEAEKERVYKLYLEIYGKNGISKLIMRTMTPLLNSELQKLLEGAAQFQLEIRINDKNDVEFIMIDNATQLEKSIASGSGYEKTVASLALRAVLAKICALPKPDIIVMDEVFGKIANDNLEMVGEFFVKIKNYFEKILLITHNPLVSNWSDNIIKITKENNISKIN